MGKYLADASIWIAMVSILAVFDMNKAKDEFGREIDVVPEYTPGVIMCVYLIFPSGGLLWPC